MAFEQRPEGSEGASLADIRRKDFWAEGIGSTEVLNQKDVGHLEE